MMSDQREAFEKWVLEEFGTQEKHLLDRDKQGRYMDTFMRIRLQAWQAALTQPQPQPQAQQAAAVSADLAVHLLNFLASPTRNRHGEALYQYLIDVGCTAPDWLRKEVQYSKAYPTIRHWAAIIKHALSSAPAAPQASVEPKLYVSAIRPIAVEAIRNLMGQPDITHDGKSLVDEMESVARAALAARQPKKQEEPTP